MCAVGISDAAVDGYTCDGNTVALYHFEGSPRTGLLDDDCQNGLSFASGGKTGAGRFGQGVTFPEFLYRGSTPLALPNGELSVDMWVNPDLSSQQSMALIAWADNDANIVFRMALNRITNDSHTLGFVRLLDDWSSATATTSALRAMRCAGPSMSFASATSCDPTLRREPIDLAPLAVRLASGR